MEKIKIYENPEFQEITDNTLRPGGFELTRRAIDYCEFNPCAALLDIGCGKGATVEYMEEQYDLFCTGIDSSALLINEGLKRNHNLNLIVGNSERLPFKNKTLEGVIAECSFSLMKNKQIVVDEVKRVLQENGKFIISDMYHRNHEINHSEDITIETCVLNAFILEELKALLIRNGFKVLLLEDYTHRLKELMATIVMQYGSLDYFWQIITNQSIDCHKMSGMARDVKLGYFLLIAKLEV